MEAWLKLTVLPVKRPHFEEFGIKNKEREGDREQRGDDTEQRLFHVRLPSKSGLHARKKSI
jgi:hypothetical protein